MDREKINRESENFLGKWVQKVALIRKPVPRIAYCSILSRIKKRERLLPRESAILVFSPPLVSEIFFEISQLGRTEFDNFENTPDHFDDNLSSFHDIAQGNDCSFEIETSFL